MELLCPWLSHVIPFFFPKLLLTMLALGALRILDMLREKFSSNYTDGLKKMQDQLDDETMVITALKAVRGSSGGSTSVVQSNRTAATPEWSGDFPWNFRKHMPCSCISVADFESNNTHLDFMAPEKNTIRRTSKRNSLVWVIFCSSSSNTSHWNPVLPTSIHNNFMICMLDWLQSVANMMEYDGLYVWGY